MHAGDLGAPPTGRVAMVCARRRGSQAWGQIDALFQSLGPHGGFLVGVEPEALLVSFDNPVAALHWSMDLLESRGPRLPPLSLGAHLAMSVPLPDDTGFSYAGGLAQWAEVLSRMAGTGEALVSGSLWTSAGDPFRRQREVVLQDLGDHRLAELEGEESLIQLGPPGQTLPTRTLDTLDPGRTNLTRGTTAFVGRDVELARLDGLFATGHRVVGLTGAGGMGKSRLARRYASLNLATYAEAGGVWWCDLGGVGSIDALVSNVARALRIPLRRGGIKGINQVAHALASRGRTLLVLDGFENLADRGAIALEHWLSQAPDCRILITTRVRVDVDAEAVVLGPLDHEAGCALFALRATEVANAFQYTDHAEDIEGIVERLEAIPLAIELAAAWTSMIPPQVILNRLSESLRMLSGAPASRTTMTAVMQWSWQLLEHWERSALSQLSVFRGGATLDAVEGVLDKGPNRVPRDAMAVVMALRDKSLVRTSSSPEDPQLLRVDMYEVVREYAEQRALSFGVQRATAHRHASWYLDRAEEWAASIKGRHAHFGLRRMAAERANLLAAWRYAIAASPDMAVRLALGLHPLLTARGPFDQHLPLLDEAVRQSADTALELRIRARCARVDALLARGHYDRAHADLSATMEALDEVDAQADHANLLAMVQHRMGRVEIQFADFSSARVHMEQAIGGYEQSADQHAGAEARGHLADLLFATGEWEASRASYGKALTDLQELGDLRTAGVLSGSMGNLKRAMGEEAAPLYAEALASLEEVGDLPGQAQILGNLGSMYLDRDQGEEAEDHYHRALTLHRQVGDVHRAAIVTGNLGRLMHRRGELRPSLDHYGEALLTLDTVNDRRFTSIYQSNRGLVFQEQGEARRAESEHREALDRLRDVGDPRFEALVLGRLATALVDLAQLEEAAECLREAHQRVEILGDRGGRTVLAFQNTHVRMVAARRVDPAEIRALVIRAGKSARQPSWDLRIAMRLFQVSAARAARALARG